MHAALRPFRRYADFGGRATRGEYWGYALLLFVLFALAAWLDAVLGTGGSRLTVVDVGQGYWGEYSATRAGWVTKLLALGTILPSFAVAVRRLHDVGFRGWWLLVGFVPLVGWLVLFVILVTDGQRGRNRWGADLKEAQLR